MLWMVLQSNQESHHTRRRGPIRLFALQTQHPKTKNTKRYYTTRIGYFLWCD